MIIKTKKDDQMHREDNRRYKDWVQYRHEMRTMDKTTKVEDIPKVIRLRDLGDIIHKDKSHKKGNSDTG